MFHALRILMVLAGIALVVFAVGSFQAARSVEDRFTALLAAKPICLPLDLSTPGDYSGRYEKDSGVAHGDLLRLSIAGSPSLEEVRRGLVGLSAEITVMDESGENPVRQTLSAKDFHPWGLPEKGLGVELAVHEAGDYQLTVHVEKSAKGMAGRPHCLIGEYRLCGLERLPALILNAIGVGCLAIGMALLAFNGGFRSRTSTPRKGQPQDAGSGNHSGPSVV